MSLINTRMLQVRSQTNLDWNELRGSRYGALELFQNQSRETNGILTPDMFDAARRSLGRGYEVPAIDFENPDDIVIGNERSLVVQDAENTSQMVQINFATYVFGFTMIPVRFTNNEIGAQRDFERKLMKHIYKLGSLIDGQCLAALGTNKTQVVANTLGYPFTNNEVVIPYEERLDAFGRLNIMFESNDHYGPISVVAEGGSKDILNQLSKYKLYNERDERFQYDSKDLYFTNRLVPEVGQSAAFYGVSGSFLGNLFRFDREAEAGTTMANGRSWGLDTIPGLNLPCGTMYYEEAIDGSAVEPDMKAVRKQFFQWSLDIAVLTGYNSTLGNDPGAGEPQNANPIIKVVISNPVTP